MARTEMHLTLRMRWWFPWFLRAISVYAWGAHRLVSEEYIERLAERAGGFVAQHGFKTGIR